MSNELISIIVPCYNCEKYINRCLSSILNQTYKNIEILCVNDGSTDDTLKLLMYFQNNFEQIKVFNIKNSGPSIARNIGLDNSKGKYITFIDSDDYIDDHYIEKLYSAIRENNVKVVRTNYFIFDNSNNKKESQIHYQTNFFTGKEILENEIFNTIAWNTVWGELIDSSLLKNVRFNNTKRIGEDLFFNIELYEQLDKVMFLNERLYFYFENSLGITKNISIENLKKNLDDAICNYSELYKKFKNEKLITKLVQSTISYQLQMSYVNKKYIYYMFDLLKRKKDLREMFFNYNERKYRLYVYCLNNNKRKIFKLIVNSFYIPMKTVKEILKKIR